MTTEPSDREYEQERHARRMMLMRMQGDIERAQTRIYIGYAIAGVLALLALIGVCLF